MSTKFENKNTTKMFKNVFQIIYERLNDPLAAPFCVLYTQNKLINCTQVHSNVMNPQS